MLNAGVLRIVCESDLFKIATPTLLTEVSSNSAEVVRARKPICCEISCACGDLCDKKIWLIGKETFSCL
jgi:hypothetical protein